MLLGKTIFNIRQKGGPPLLLPTSLLQLPRCLTRTYNLTSYDTTLFELDSFKKCNCSKKNISANLICFANVGCSPTPRQHFWKNCWIKKLSFACGSFFWTVNFCKSNVSHETNQELLLEKTIFNIRQKGGPPLLLPTSLLQLPRCLAWTYNLTSYDTTLFELDSFEKCNCSRKNISANLICFANVGYSPTPRQHFWKIVGSKNFHLPAARFFERSISAKAMFHMKQIKNCS